MGRCTTPLRGSTLGKFDCWSTLSFFHHDGDLTIVSRLEELFAEVDAGHHIAAALLQPHVRVVLKAGGGQLCGGW